MPVYSNQIWNDLKILDNSITAAFEPVLSN